MQVSASRTVALSAGWSRGESDILRLDVLCEKYNIYVDKKGVEQEQSVVLEPQAQHEADVDAAFEIVLERYAEVFERLSKT